jgi:hypothetical protein
LREYLATLSRPQTYANPQPAGVLIGQIRTFERRFRVADENAQVTGHLLALMNQTQIGGKQIHDANIVATMLEYGISRLLTHNIQDFGRFSSMITIIPLK